MAKFGNLSSLGFVGHGDKGISRLGHALQTQNLNRKRRRSRFDLVSAIVVHGPHFSIENAADEGIARV